MILNNVLFLMSYKLYILCDIYFDIYVYYHCILYILCEIYNIQYVT